MNELSSSALHPSHLSSLLSSFIRIVSYLELRTKRSKGADSQTSRNLMQIPGRQHGRMICNSTKFTVSSDSTWESSHSQSKSLRMALPWKMRRRPFAELLCCRWDKATSKLECLWATLMSPALRCQQCRCLQLHLLSGSLTADGRVIITSREWAAHRNIWRMLDIPAHPSAGIGNYQLM